MGIAKKLTVIEKVGTAYLLHSSLAILNRARDFAQKIIATTFVIVDGATLGDHFQNSRHHYFLPSVMAASRLQQQVCGVGTDKEYGNITRERVSHWPTA